jgi:hypothetical protein
MWVLGLLVPRQTPSRLPEHIRTETSFARRIFVKATMLSRPLLTILSLQAKRCVSTKLIRATQTLAVIFKNGVSGIRIALS